MGQPRASRRKVVQVSSDEEDLAPQRPVSDASEDDEPVKPQRRGTAKTKSSDKAKRKPQSTPVTATQDVSSLKSPAKPKVTKTKSKTVAKDAVPANGKPIYSFFNAATQRQLVSQPSASPEKVSQQDEPEAIHDDSDDAGSSLAFSKGSSTALAVRKRKAGFTAGLQDDSSLALPSTQKFRKTSDGGRVSSFRVVNEDRRPWTEQFAPLDLSELAVHKRKVNDVRQWLGETFNGRRQRVLVLKGAAGTGKTTTVRLLAKELAANISEWQNPAGADMTAEGSATTAGHFEDFIRRAGKAATLTFAGDNDVGVLNTPPDDDYADATKQIVLVEEFPNTFSRASATLQAFRSTLMQYVSSPTAQEGQVTPIVMIISETLLSTNTAVADSFTAHRLLGPELINHPLINTIEFNPVATTILTKALEAIVVKEARKSGRRKTPGPQVLKRLAETGDIRSALSSLEFLCLRGDDAEAWSSKVQFTKPKKKSTEPALTKAEADALKLVTNRESSLGIFHAVGRVVYNGRIDPPVGTNLAQPPAWLPQHRRTKVPKEDMDSLIDEMGTETSTFVAALHENYALSCATSSAEDSLDSLSGCAESISDADLLSLDRFSFGTRAFSGSAVDGLRQDEMAFQVAVRGILFSLPTSVHRTAGAGGSAATAHRMFYPTSLKLWKQKEEIEGLLEMFTTNAQSGKLDETRSAYSARSSTRSDGVESWKRNNNFAELTPQPDSDASQNIPSTNTKAEMLLERLPYLSQVLASRQRGSEPSLLLRQALMVSGVNGRTTAAPDDANIEQDEDDARGGVETWATDKPDTDGPANKARPRMTGKQKNKTEGGGLGIPVETRVEKLVLEDDDIVDY
ncbi:RFC checkpoint protein Rad17 [Elasticomyces elasticus]|nr:RFC checkpoint protein Rad17 [Elasticomyces elasticus]